MIRHEALQQATAPGVVSTAAPEKLRWPAVAACAIGLMVLFGVGFAGSDTLHNAAHDTRHAFNFPCH